MKINFFSPGSVLATFSADFDVSTMDTLIATDMNLLVETIRMDVALAFVNYCKIYTYEFMNSSYSCAGIKMFSINGGKNLIFHASSTNILKKNHIGPSWSRIPRLEKFPIE